MWIILILLLAGTLSGYAFSRVSGFNRITDKVSLYTIYVLLFFMGLSVGTRKDVMKNLTSIGIDAFLISIFTISGSLITAFFLYRYIFRKDEK